MRRKPPRLGTGQRGSCPAPPPAPLVAWGGSGPARARPPSQLVAPSDSAPPDRRHRKHPAPLPPGRSAKPSAPPFRQKAPRHPAPHGPVPVQQSRLLPLGNERE